MLTDLPNNVCIVHTATNATDMLQVVDFSHLLPVAANLLTSSSCSKSVKIRLVVTLYLQTCCKLLKQLISNLWIKCQLSICSKPVDNLQETCCHQAKQAMQTHPDIGLTTEARNRLAATYPFLAVYSHIIIINVCECCVDYIKMLMQWTSITVINTCMLTIDSLILRENL